MKPRLLVGSLFSGIGGLDLGLERAGMEVRWQVEIDPYCQKVLAKHWPHVKRYGDIKELSGEELEPVDLICGGFPCQPVSLAGKGLAQADPRWLWPEFERLLGILRPRYAVIENVPGLYDRGLADVLCGLAKIGFDAEWTTLSAAAFGAPHLRERVFVVAYSSDKRCIGSIFTNGQHELPYYQAWNAAQDIRDWEGWKRWLESIREDGFDSDSYSEPSEEQGEGNQLREAVREAASGRGYLVDARKRIVRPLVCGVDDGIPDLVDRIKSIGNAVVPQVAEWIGRRIMEIA